MTLVGYTRVSSSSFQELNEHKQQAALSFRSAFHGSEWILYMSLALQKSDVRFHPQSQPQTPFLNWAEC